MDLNMDKRTNFLAIFLGVLLIAISGYLVYSEFFNKEKSDTPTEEKNKNETGNGSENKSDEELLENRIYNLSEFGEVYTQSLYSVNSVILETPLRTIGIKKNVVGDYNNDLEISGEGLSKTLKINGEVYFISAFRNFALGNDYYMIYVYQEENFEEMNVYLYDNEFNQILKIDKVQVVSPGYMRDGEGGDTLYFTYYTYDAEKYCGEYVKTIAKFNDNKLETIKTVYGPDKYSGQVC